MRSFIITGLIVLAPLLGSSLGAKRLRAFEHTKVLPKGVRNLTLKNVGTSLAFKSDAAGKVLPLGQALEKELTFARIAKGESGMKKTQLLGLLLAQGFDLEESLGQIKADMKGQVAVTAPLFSYGLSESFTLALAVPYYQAHMAVDVGFQMNQPVARRFLRVLEEKNELTSANEVAAKLNDAVGELNKKLVQNGYRAMTDWHGSGLGDITLAGKYRALEGRVFKLASSSGVIFPTGKTADPDILNAIPFGKGNYSAFASLLADEYVRSDLFFNEYAKYTHNFPSQRQVRLATAEESVEVGKAKADYQLGGAWELGSSLQYEPSFGLVAGLGYVFSKKNADTYQLQGQPAVVAKLQADTAQETQHWETRLGYSAVPAFARGESKVPFTASVEYKKHIKSVNAVANDFIGVDLALYF